MAAIINDRDVLLLGAETRVTEAQGSDFFLQANATGFTVNSSGVASPGTITITAVLINLDGVATFTATGGSVTDNHDNTATIAYNTYTGTTATISATLAGMTRSITIGSVSGGTKGDPGAPGMQYKDVSLFQWSTAIPNKPTGTSSWSWVNSVNAAYSASDGWATIDNLPQNPGGTGVKLYTATASISAPGNTVSTIVSYANAAVQALSINGNNGVSGTMSQEVVVYRWDTSIPTPPAGTATLKWSDRTFAAPSGWEITPSVPTSQGLTRYAARVQVIDVATALTTSFNWNSAAVYVAAASGNNGAAGPSGASSTIAYAASSSFGDTFAPAQTTGKNSVPAPNSGGIVGTYSLTVPTVAVGQRMYQTDGIYDPITNKVTWSAPYWSVFKVGSLAAITGIMGKLTITDTIADANGNWSIDGNGHMIARSAEFIDPNTGATVLSLGGRLNPTYAPSGTLNSDIAPTGGNLIPNNSLPSSASGFVIRNVNNIPLESATPTWENANHSYGNLGSVYVHATGTPAANTVVDILKDSTSMYPVTPGQRYEAGVDLAANRCSAYISLDWYAANGSYISPTLEGNVIDQVYPDANTNPFPRSVVFGTAPANAAFAMLYVRQRNNGIQANPYTFASKWYFGKAGTTQTAASVWADSQNSFAASISAKLNKAGNDAITGSIALQSAQALLVGDSNNGIYYGSTGLVGRKAGQTTFAILADGSATFAGGLLAAYGTLGSLMLAANGYIASGAFTSYAWPANNGIGFYLGPEGMKFGNPSTGKYFNITADGNVYGPGFKIENGQLTIENPIIINPDLRIPALNISVSTPTGTSSTMSRNVKNGATQTAYVSVSGGSGNYSISYDATGDTNCRPTNLTGTQSAIFVDGPGVANSDGLGYVLKITVVDNNSGKQGVAFVNYAVVFN